MKKVLLGLFALSAVAFAAETNVYLKAGIDVWQDYETLSSEGESVTSDEADSLGYEIGVEVTKEVFPNFELGLGLSYQDHGDIKTKRIYDRGVDYEDITDVVVGSYKSLPLYIIGKYNIPLESNIKPYVKVDLGYSFNFDEEDVKVSWNWKENNIISTQGTEKLSTSMDNGIYYGIGIGAEYNNFLMELMYKTNKAEMEVTDGIDKIKGDLDYSRVTLSFGYKFNF